MVLQDRRRGGLGDPDDPVLRVQPLHVVRQREAVHDVADAGQEHDAHGPGSGGIQENRPIRPHDPPARKLHATFDASGTSIRYTPGPRSVCPLTFTRKSYWPGRGKTTPSMGMISW